MQDQDTIYNLKTNEGLSINGEPVQFCDEALVAKRYL